MVAGRLLAKRTASLGVLDSVGKAWLAVHAFRKQKAARKNVFMV
jgi:hypothetical protein